MTETSVISLHQNGFLLESLSDLDGSLRSYGAKLHIFKGCPLAVFNYLHNEFNLNKICCQTDCEPIYQARDNAVKSKLWFLTVFEGCIYYSVSFLEFCADSNIDFCEQDSHTLWNPVEIIKSNGGTPPLTYEMFLVSSMPTVTILT